jgi:hypothetical protein
MQGLGWSARASFRPVGNEPWAHNVWVEGSPYLKTAQEVDLLVGEFVAWLKQEGFWEKTLIFLTADHGISEVGRHPYWDPDSAESPLIILGPGVKRGVQFDYAESIDIVPTLAYLAGIRCPRTATGVVLSEALVDPPGNQQRRTITMEQINDLIYAYDELLPKAQVAALKHPAKRSAIEVLDNTFYGLRRFGEWNDFTSAAEVYEHNKKVYEQVRKIAGELDVP